MKLKLRMLFIFLISFTCILNTHQPAFAGGETPVLKVAISEDESIIVERILYTALKRLGYQMVTVTADMRTSVNEVSYGSAAIVPAQTEGLDKEYPNLVMIPLPISYEETTVYTRADESYQFNKWSDIKGLRLSHCWKNLYITRNISRAEASSVVTLNEYNDLWNSLLTGETDVSVIPNLTGYIPITPSGIKLAGIIEREPRYTYVNKEYSYLVPLITEVYEDMVIDGTMGLIRDCRQTDDKDTVLHISSYSSHVEWEHEEIEAIRKSLDLSPYMEYHNLNLNSRQIHNKANLNSIIVSTIRTIFIEQNPDIIIASDDDALEFVLNNYYMLFPKTPVVFCGVNNYDRSILHGFNEYVTGVAESISLYETIDKMVELYPATKKVYILNDYTHSGLIWKNSLQKLIDDGDLPVECVFNENKAFSDILNDISGFDSSTLVLLGTYFLDSNNGFYLEKEVQELVCNASKMPVFCLASSFNGNGTLGGMVTSGAAHGSTAGTMAKRILNGTPISKIPIITDSRTLNQWQADYVVAEKFNINTKLFPDGHTVINRKQPIWESNRFEFGLAMTIIGFFVIIIIGLVIFLRLIAKKNAYLLEVQGNLHTAEELLAKDEELLKTIDIMPVSVLIADIETCRLEYVNQAFLTANGFDSLEKAKQLDMSPIVEHVSSLGLGDSVTFNYGSLRNPDSEICQRISAEKLTYHDKDCLLLISEDITAHLKENEMLARAAQKEKEANMLKGIFLANMSHEIRTPMNAIIGLSQLALLKQQTPENESFFSKINNSAKNLLSIINDILDFSKIEAEKIDLVEEEFDLEETITNAFMVTVDSTGSKNLKILLDMHPDVPCYLYGDCTRLWQILKNILDNSVKYTVTGHVVLTIEVANVKGDSVSLHFNIRDTGIGMTSEQLERIFTPFEQLHQAGFKNKKAGTGLGMSITKQLIGLMHGSINVRSAANEGTEFSIILPFKLPSKSKTINEITSGYSLPKGPLLLVDNDNESLRIMTRLLNDRGVSAVAAHSSGEVSEAIDSFAAKGIEFQTVIIDYTIGSESGLDIAKLINSSKTKAKLFLVTPCLKHILPPELLREAGIADVIERPYTISTFMQKICGAKADASPTQQKNAKYPKARILICEDNEINQIVASSILEEFGINSEIAANGQEAIDMLDEREYDLIFMDIIMPVMDGHEATLAIRKSVKPYHNIPICALTANVMVDEVQRCMSEGMDAHVEKPLSIEAIAAVLNKFLNNLAE